MKDNPLVVIANNQVLTDSRTVATHFGKNHKDVMRDIRNLVDQAEDERKIAPMFSESTYADKYGRTKPQFLMNRDGFSLLAMGFTGKKALQFKLKFIDAFNKMEEQLRRIASQTPLFYTEPRWVATRQNTKISHKPFTAAIKLLISYLREHADDTRPDSFFYGHITNIVQNACDIVKGGRDCANVACLNKCDQFQSMTANLILNLIAQGKLATLAEFDTAILAHLNNVNHLLSGQYLLLN